MKIVLIKVFFVLILRLGLGVVTSFPARAQSFGECLTNGYEFGQLATEQFCNSLETRYNSGYHYQQASMMSQFLCDTVMQLACLGAVGFTLSERPLCRELVLSDWEGAADHFAQFEQVACPLESPF